MHDAHSLANAFGYLYPKEVDLLMRLSSMVKPGGVVVIVGVGAGTSTLAFLEGNNRTRMYSVDISSGGPLGGMQNEINALNDSKFATRKEVWPKQIIGDSHDIGKRWRQIGPDRIDLIFIDAGHLEADIRGDILAWRPHVREGGIMAFHDYHRDVWPDVYKVVDELMADATFLDKADTTIAYTV